MPAKGPAGHLEVADVHVAAVLIAAGTDPPEAPWSPHAVSHVHADGPIVAEPDAAAVTPPLR